MFSKGEKKGFSSIEIVFLLFTVFLPKQHKRILKCGTFCKLAHSVFVFWKSNTTSCLRRHIFGHGKFLYFNKVCFPMFSYIQTRAVGLKIPNEKGSWEKLLKSFRSLNLVMGTFLFRMKFSCPMRNLFLEWSNGMACRKLSILRNWTWNSVLLLFFLSLVYPLCSIS